jgi:hypothetical protein
MIEVIFDFVKDILKISVLRRLLVVLFLPNVLVWGFGQIGIDNQYNPVWVALVGPYWWLEKTIFKIIFWTAAIAVVVLIVIQIVRFVGQCLASPAPPPTEPEHKITVLEPIGPFHAAYEVYQRQQQAFQALPLSEQLEIKKQQTAESLLLTAQWEKETAHIIEAKERQRKEDEALLSRVSGNHAPAASPEDAKRKALRDITGRGA